MLKVASGQVNAQDLQARLLGLLCLASIGLVSPFQNNSFVVSLSSNKDVKMVCNLGSLDFSFRK